MRALSLFSPEGRKRHTGQSGALLFRGGGCCRRGRVVVGVVVGRRVVARTWDLLLCLPVIVVAGSRLGLGAGGAVGRRGIWGLEDGAVGVAADLLREVVGADGAQDFRRSDVDLDLVGDVLRDDGVEGPLENLRHEGRAVDHVDLADDEGVVVDEDGDGLDDGGYELGHGDGAEGASLHVGDGAEAGEFAPALADEGSVVVVPRGVVVALDGVVRVRSREAVFFGGGPATAAIGAALAGGMSSLVEELLGVVQ
mmetsp:Transcript_10593/g.35022  ORF Transcript_10593/g.35022 Transcript_10593/m.35022 type:complete len:253 (+) Transcript_10593:137-895(+)